MSVTIREVAREASVSVATVSRVLNGKGPVRPDTERRIRRAARLLRYVPHGGARSLITRRTHTLGVLLPDLYGEFFSEVIRGIDLAARRGGYHLLVSSSHGDRYETEAMVRAMRGRVDGLIVLSPDVDRGALRANVPDKFPVVLLNSAGGGRSFDSIAVDNFGGATAMVRHLARLGHRRVAFIEGPSGNRDASERLRGYREAMRSVGEWSKELEIPGNFREEAGYEACGRIRKLRPRPSAVFAANDSMAIGLLYACREEGVCVPEELAIAGFDDIPIVRFITPSLTSVRVPIAELGMCAAQRLLEVLGGKPPGRPRREVLPTTLVVRSSCGAMLRPGARPAGRVGAREVAG
jgi:LacI family transcriptional regulator, galactose operon repressor